MLDVWPNPWMVYKAIQSLLSFFHQPSILFYWFHCSHLISHVPTLAAPWKMLAFPSLEEDDNSNGGQRRVFEYWIVANMCTAQPLWVITQDWNRTSLRLTAPSRPDGWDVQLSITIKPTALLDHGSFGERVYRFFSRNSLLNSNTNWVLTPQGEEREGRVCYFDCRLNSFCLCSSWLRYLSVRHSPIIPAIGAMSWRQFSRGEIDPRIR